MRIKASDVKVGDVVKDRGTVARMFSWAEFIDITWEDGRKDTLHNGCSLNVERPLTAMEEASLDGADKDFTNETWNEVRAAEHETAAARAELVEKLDAIIFDPSVYRQIRRHGADVAAAVIAGEDPWLVLRNAMAMTENEETIPGILDMVKMVREAGL